MKKLKHKLKYKLNNYRAGKILKKLGNPQFPEIELSIEESEYNRLSDQIRELIFFEECLTSPELKITTNLEKDISLKMYGTEYVLNKRFMKRSDRELNEAITRCYQTLKTELLREIEHNLKYSYGCETAFLKNPVSTSFQQYAKDSLVYRAYDDSRGREFLKKLDRLYTFIEQTQSSEYVSATVREYPKKAIVIASPYGRGLDFYMEIQCHESEQVSQHVLRYIVDRNIETLLNNLIKIKTDILHEEIFKLQVAAMLTYKD